MSISPSTPSSGNPPRRGPVDAPALPYGQAASIAHRFWPKVDQQTPDECWPWIGGRTGGYGFMRLGSRAESNVYAHRVSYALANDGIDRGLTVDHLCRNRGCVNPAHLEAVSLAENIRRRNSWREKCRHGHLYDGVRVRNGRESRTCSTCKREATSRYEARVRGEG